jgi:hypothetical protein
MGKVNRRIDGKSGYQKAYGAWMCRQWATQHNGVAPKRVKFDKRWTRLPKPDALIKQGLETGVWGYDPWELESRQKQQKVVDCEKTVHAQLNNELRARHSLPQLDDDGFQSLRVRTWWDKREAETKERRQRRQDVHASQREGF